MCYYGLNMRKEIAQLLGQKRGNVAEGRPSEPQYEIVREEVVRRGRRGKPDQVKTSEAFPGQQERLEIDFQEVHVQVELPRSGGPHLKVVEVGTDGTSKGEVRRLTGTELQQGITGSSHDTGRRVTYRSRVIPS
jgi:hypothetical protein